MSLLHSRLIKSPLHNKLLKLPKDLSTLKFGQTFSPHMLTIDWTKKEGWSAPEISAVADFKIHPASSCLHYGVECFEGLKAFRGTQDNKVRLFRPDMNIQRFKTSLERICLPFDFEDQELLDCIRSLVRVDEDFVPKQEGYSLYIRPACIGTHPSVGVSISESCKLFVLCSPVGPYYPTGFKPVSLLAEERYARAWPGGTGALKIGANYAIALGPQQKAQLKGFSQVLWLFQDELTEVGTMNVFVVLGNLKNGTMREIVTPPLNGMILPGVTRDSTLALCKQWYPDVKVSERSMTMSELVEANQAGELMEMFGCGTAAVVSPIKSIQYKDTLLTVPLTAEGGQMGPLSQRVWKALHDIQYGKTPSKWMVEV